MSKKKSGKVTAKKVGRKIKGVFRLTGAVILAGAATEATYVGARMMCNDVEFAGKAVKGAISPEPVWVRKGLFGKKMAVINPVTGKVSDYTGNKVPSSNKVIKIKKGGR